MEIDEESTTSFSVLIILDQKSDEEIGIDFISLPEPNRVLDDEDGRIGEFVYLETGQIKVLKRTDNENSGLFELIQVYNNENYNESLIIDRYRRKLASIPKDLASLWSNVTKFINSEIINKLRPIEKIIKSKCYIYNDDVEGVDESRSDLDLRKIVLRDLKVEQDDPLKTRQLYNSVVQDIKNGKLPTVDLMKSDDIKKDSHDDVDRTKLSDVNSSNEADVPAPLSSEGVEDSFSYIYYSDVPTYNKLATTPEMVSSMNMDTSFVLDSIREDYKSTKYGYKCIEYKHNYYLYILGELQYSFILFLLCYNIDSFQQYKKLLRAFCNAERVIIENDELACELFKTLRYHIEAWDEDYDIFKEDDFFKMNLINLREIVVDNESNLSQCRVLFNKVEDSFKLKFGIALFDLSIE